jgi:hypothetical protein
MPQNIADDPIPGREMAFALLVISGTMTDREAAEEAGLDLDAASDILAKPRVRAFMLEHRARIKAKLGDQQAQELRQRNLVRDQTLARLWELANLSPEATRGSIAGQVKVMAMIVAIEGLIPDRRQPQTKNQPATPLPKPQIYVAEWLREQKEREAQGLEPTNKVAQAVTAEAPKPESAPEPAPQNHTSPARRDNGSWVPDAATGTIFDPKDPRAPLWMRMKKRRR